jgi:hypothetical protein
LRALHAAEAMRVPTQSSFAALVVLLVGAAGCHRKASAPAPPGPASEVILTNEQMARLKIVTTTVDLQDVDDTVATSGKIVYDDQKVMHVFSAVAGTATAGPTSSPPSVTSGGTAW